jgi:hypothetical protein
MQNASIESRTQLRLESEIEEQKSKLADFKLSKGQERTKLGKAISQLCYNVFKIVIFVCIFLEEKQVATVQYTCCHFLSNY